MVCHRVSGACWVVPGAAQLANTEAPAVFNRLVPDFLTEQRLA
jgi:hypothetical protein